MVFIWHKHRGTRYWKNNFALRYDWLLLSDVRAIKKKTRHFKHLRPLRFMTVYVTVNFGFIFIHFVNMLLLVFGNYCEVYKHDLYNLDDFKVQ